MTTGRKLLLCNCNRTMSVDAKTIAGALKLDSVPVVASELCRRQAGNFERACKSGDDVLVACTQEAPLFTELHEAWKATGEIRFVNVREHAGWSEEGARAAPKMAALVAIADVPPPEPVGVVHYESAGQLLIIGPARAALPWAERLCGELTVSVLATDSRGGAAAELGTERKFPVYSGRDVAVSGHLGAFDVTWKQANPIDLDLCTRCGACVKACPEQAIDYGFQVDMDRCGSHRRCVAACGPIGAINFSRADAAREDCYDLILDLSEQPLLRTVQLPQGYVAPGADALQQALSARQLEQLVGEFEKPRFFAYNERICAHGRSGIVGCTRCIDVCSTSAITSDVENNRVQVDPHLCMGCGGCATVCPSGAMTYAYPRVADSGARLRAALGAYRAAVGATPCILFHDTSEGKALLARLARHGRGLPAHVIPLEVIHVASIGPDLLLGTLALGASHVVVLSTGTEPAQYRDALGHEVELSNTILTALGYGTRAALLHCTDASTLERAVWALEPVEAVPAATFNLSNEKRRTLDFVLEHLVRHAPTAADVIPLQAGAPFGQVLVDRTKCTLCLACVGACPENALVDSKDSPQLRFIERNCVQCGLCEKTCPEDAIRLVPRLLLGASAKAAVVLNETEPFHCVRCAKPFGTRQMIDNMLGRLSGHAMFGTPAALRRLQMCADCRVLDMMSETAQPSIFEFSSGAAKTEQ